jgi:large subunit ribosomal protein L19e
MNTSSQKRIAAQVLKCGKSRVKLKEAQEVEEALTRQDVRDLVQKGEVYKKQKKGTSKFASRKRLAQKKKGRMRGMGKRKGTIGARKKDKTKWIEAVRAQRSLLRELRDNGKIDVSLYRKLYMRVKGGFFRNRSHIMMYLKEHELMKGMRPETAKAAKKPAPKSAPKKEAKKIVRRAEKPAPKKPAAKKPAKKAKKPTAKKPVKKAAKKPAPKKAAPKKAAKKPAKKLVRKAAPKKAKAKKK